jgi:dephospho-CoA kinase
MPARLTKSLIILRGIPGSGKSTLARILSEGNKYPVFSVDDYFTSADGGYRFEFEKKPPRL